MKRPEYKDAPPVEINQDLPHLRDGGVWSSTGPDSGNQKGLPERRMEYYLGQLKVLGMSDADAQCMMGDLYWDCYAELRAVGKIKGSLCPD